MTNRVLVGAVFLVGCAVGGVSSQLVVPKASAQQAATLPMWEMTCADITGMSAEEMIDAAHKAGRRLGAQRWEPIGGNNGIWCFKRPKM